MRRLVPFVLIGVVLLAWELAARSGLWSPLLFPPLANIAHEFVQFVSRADRLFEAWVSLYRALGTTTLKKMRRLPAPMLRPDQTRMVGTALTP